MKVKVLEWIDHQTIHRVELDGGKKILMDLNASGELEETEAALVGRVFEVEDYHAYQVIANGITEVK